MNKRISMLLATAAFGLGAGSLAVAQDQPQPQPPAATAPGESEAKPSEAQPTAGQDQKTQPGMAGQTATTTTMGQAQELNKHLGMVDLYLTGAINNAKYLSTFADMAKGKGDKKIITEAQRNLDMTIDRAIKHVGHVESMHGQTAMTGGASGQAGASGQMGAGGQTGASGTAGAAADTSGQMGASGAQPGASGESMPGQDPAAASARQPVAGTDRQAKVDELERHLKGARSAAKKLSGAKHEQLATRVTPVATHLSAAERSFRDLAKLSNYTLVQDQKLDAVPVSGSDATGEQGQHDHGSPPAQPGGQPPNQGAQQGSQSGTEIAPESEGGMQDRGQTAPADDMNRDETQGVSGSEQKELEQKLDDQQSPEEKGAEQRDMREPTQPAPGDGQ